MKLQIIPPSPKLAGIVKHYWLMEYHYPERTIHSQCVVPTGLPELSFFLADQVSCKDLNRDFNSHAIISGQQNSYYHIHAKGHLRMLTVTFLPQGFSAITKVPFNELFNQTVDAQLVLGDEVQYVCEQLSEITHPTEQISLLETFISGLINKSDTNYTLPRINRSLKFITPANPSTTVQLLAEQACWSRKQFERVFAQTVGCTPKQFINVVRFQYALHLKASNPTRSLVDIAFASGYYDQSHMCNDFIRQSGLSPNQYFSLCAPQSDYFDF